MAKKLYTSPLGVAVYPHLNQPDTKFNKDGMFSVKLEVPAEDGGREFAARLDSAIDQSVADAKAEAKEGSEIKRADPPYKEDQEKGTFTFNFKVKHRNQTREGTEFFRRPILFDSAGQRADDAKVGGGSQLRVSYEPSLFYTPMIGAGVSLRLFAVQIVSLIEWGERDASGYGFEGVEGGFVQEPTEASGFESATETDTPTEGKEGDPFDF